MEIISPNASEVNININETKAINKMLPRMGTSITYRDKSNIVVRLAIDNPIYGRALLISGMGLMMPTMIFSGIIFPCESMPEILQYVSDIMPAKWYIIMVKKVMIEGVGIAYILKELSILSFMMVVLFFVSIKSFKTRF